MTDSTGIGGLAGKGPERYEIRVRGHLSERWSLILEGAALRNEPNGEAVIAVSVPDQAALHGILTRLHGLGLPLVAVNRILPDPEEQ
jgi:hypothetical protein